MAESYVESSRAGTTVFSRVSWGAVFAGVVITLVLQALLTLLGIGIGAAKVEPLQQAEPGKGLTAGAAIWFLISTLIAVYVGAMIAGKKSGSVTKGDRGLHGLLVWGTSAIIGVVSLTTTAGAFLGGAGSLLGGTAAMTQRAPMIGSYSQNAAQGGRTGLSPTGRETGNQPADEQQMRAAADTAARRVSQAAWWSFAVLLLSGAAAWFAAGRTVREGAYSPRPAVTT
jgi:hypothetical protein